MEASGSPRTVKGGLRMGVRGDPGSVVIWSKAGSGFPQPRPRGTPVLSWPLHCTLEPSGWPWVAPQSTHSSGSLLSACGASRSGPCPHVLQAGHPSPPRPHRELDTHSQIWVEKTDAGRQPESPPLHGGNPEWEGRPGFLQAVDCLKVWGPWGGGGAKGLT